MQHAEEKTLCRILVGGGRVGRSELRKPVRIWEDNIKWMLHKDDGRAWIGFIWLDSDKRRNFVHTVMNFRIPQMSGGFWLDEKRLASKKDLALCS